VKTWFRENITVLLAVTVLVCFSLWAKNYINDYQYKILADVGIAIIAAVSLNLINGITGQFSLGHAGFMAVGAYTAAAISVFYIKPHLGETGLWAGLALIGGLLAGGTAAALAGLIVGVPTLRLRGDYLAIATLGFGEIIRIVLQNMQVVGGPLGMFGIPVMVDLLWVSLWVVVCVVIIFRLVHSVKGRAFPAIREDEFASAAIGINTTRYKVMAFTIGSFFAGIAGGLFAHSATGYISPGQFDFLKSVEIVVMVVLGGLGSITGSIIAATVLTLLPEWLRGFSEYRMVVYSALLIIVMLTRPQGLMGMKECRIPWRRNAGEAPRS
jgi:branched-chain amino acid transport system permease protein